MNNTITYSIGPALHSGEVVPGTANPAQPWFAISGPARRQSSEMAARIADLERKLAALEALGAHTG